jgi:hypothetical protein
MGGGRGRIVTDTKDSEPDEDLLEFLGSIDEANEDSGEGGFQDYLAGADIDEAAEPPESAGKEGKRE